MHRNRERQVLASDRYAVVLVRGNNQRGRGQGSTCTHAYTDNVLLLSHHSSHGGGQLQVRLAVRQSKLCARQGAGRGQANCAAKQVCTMRIRACVEIIGVSHVDSGQGAAHGPGSRPVREAKAGKVYTRETTALKRERKGEGRAFTGKIHVGHGGSSVENKRVGGVISLELQARDPGGIPIMCGGTKHKRGGGKQASIAVRAG